MAKKLWRIYINRETLQLSWNAIEKLVSGITFLLVHMQL